MQILYNNKFLLERTEVFILCQHSFTILTLLQTILNSPPSGEECTYAYSFWNVAPKDPDAPKTWAKALHEIPNCLKREHHLFTHTKLAKWKGHSWAACLQVVFASQTCRISQPRQNIKLQVTPFKVTCCLGDSPGSLILKLNKKRLQILSSIEVIPSYHHPSSTVFMFQVQCQLQSNQQQKKIAEMSCLSSINLTIWQPCLHHAGNRHQGPKHKSLCHKNLLLENILFHVKYPTGTWFLDLWAYRWAIACEITPCSARPVICWVSSLLKECGLWWNMPFWGNC